MREYISVDPKDINWLEVYACTQCACLVMDKAVHEADHLGRDSTARYAAQALTRSYDYTPYGR